MRRILCHKVIVDGRCVGPMAMLTVDDNGGYIDVSAFDGVECHSTSFLSGTVEVCNEAGRRIVFMNGKKIDINNDIH